MACPFDITPQVLPNATANVPYSTIITASNGTPPYVFIPPSDAYGVLPLNGLSLVDNGDGTATLSGTPTSWSLVLTGCDSAIPSNSIFSPCFMGTEIWTFSARLIRQCDISRDIFRRRPFTECSGTIAGPAMIDNVNDSLLDIQNKLYAALNPFFNGKIRFTVTAGITDPCIDPSLRIMPVKILMEGIGDEFWCDPAGTLQIAVFDEFCLRNNTTVQLGSITSFNISVTDNDGCQTDQLENITIIPICSDFVYTPNSLPDGTVGTSYNQLFSVSGSTPPDTFSLLSGSLPDGLTLVNNGDATATLSGMPTAEGTFTFTLKAVDSKSCGCNCKDYTITINAAPPIPILHHRRRNGINVGTICPTTIPVLVPKGTTPKSIVVYGICGNYGNPELINAENSIYQYTKISSNNQKYASSWIYAK